MKKENLVELKIASEYEAKLEEELKIKTDVFKADNKVLIDKIKEIEEKKAECRILIKNDAEAEFKLTGEKKLLGGISIRVTPKVTYSEVTAMDWAKENMPVAIKKVLDKKMFETFAKDEKNTLDFVERINNVIVCFPSEIKLEDDAA